MSGIRYVRRLAGGWSLTYHDSRCRHVRGRTDVTKVTAKELDEAFEMGGHGYSFARVRYEGKTVYLHICRVCIPAPPDWPPR